MSDELHVYDIGSLSVVREKGGTVFTLKIPEFRVRRGESLAIVGSSGCGKSTLLDLLGLIMSPTDCETFTFCGSDGRVVDLSRGVGDGKLANLRRQEIGYVLQHGALLPFLTVRQNTMLPQQLAGVKDPATVRYLLEKLGIGEQANKFPNHLSGGQRQRVAIARALAIQPPVILCDEPTAAVDVITAQEIFNQLKSLSENAGCTLIIVTHNQELVRGRVDRWFTFDVDRISDREIVSTCYECDAT